MTRNVSTHHVQQVAELVKRLTADEIEELLRLVPELQAASIVAEPHDELVEWAQQLMNRQSGEARPMRAEDYFLGDLTIADYFARPEEEREKIWADLYATAIASAPEREAKPDAAVPAG